MTQLNWSPVNPGRFNERLSGARLRRAERRLGLAAQAMLRGNETAKQVEEAFEVLAERDEAISLVDAMLLEIETEKMWAYGALLRAFADEGRLSDEQGRRFLSVLRALTNDELLGFVLELAFEPRSRMAIAPRREAPKSPPEPDASIIPTLTRWKMYQSEDRGSLDGRDLRLTGEKFDMGNVRTDGIELADLLADHVQLEWPLERVPKRRSQVWEDKLAEHESREEDRG